MATAMPFLLEVHQISKRFQGTQALDKVGFEVASGEVHALMGENGAGKSTLANIIAGVVRPDSGAISWRGKNVTIDSPLRARALGIGVVFQELDLFPHLSIAENMAIANAAAHEGFIVRPRELHSWCREFLEQVGLSVPAQTVVRDLSIGQMQLVAIARALSMKADLLLLDEPTSSLADDGVETLLKLIAKLRSQGIAIVYVSHKMAEIHRIADRITVLRDGMLINTRRADQVSTDELISMMVGRTLERRQRPQRQYGPEVLLDVRDLATTFLSPISFEVRSGEVVGLAGLVGAGRSELGAALFGLRRRVAGEISLKGRSYAPLEPSDAIRRGFCLVPEDRRWKGLFPHMSVRENATIGVLRRLAMHGWLRSDSERDVEQAFRRTLLIAAASPDMPIAALSGGNQQKTLITRWLMADPTVLFLDEPTRGIDVGAKEQIYAVIDELAAQGKGVVLASSELPELFRCCDRILVLHEGRQAGILTTSETAQEEIMALATGIQH
jgi:ABC-type sugar transport system ATPase subunit